MSLRELRRYPAGSRYCSSCKARVPHDYVTRGYAEHTQWGPVLEIQCSKCHDRTRP